MSMNRKQWMTLAGLLAAGVGAGFTGGGSLAAIPGLLGLGATGAAGAGAAAGAVPAMASMAGPGVAALAGETLAPTAMQTAMAMGGKVMSGLGTTAKVAGPMQGLLGPSAPNRPPMAPPPQPSGPMPLPGSSYSGGDMPPPGIDPNQWATMTPEQKAAMKAQRGMA